MIDNAIGTVAGLRWHLPVKTPTDAATDERHETGAIETGYAMSRDLATESQRHARHITTDSGDLGELDAGPVPTFDVRGAEIEGRAAVNEAIRP